MTYKEMESTNSIPRELGDFELIRQLGRGGMGVVYEARQKSLNRRVALKVLSSGLGLTAKAIMRFRLEAEAAAKLHHTNIVPIYATGDNDGAYYFAMELINGPSLDQLIRHMREGSDADLDESDITNSHVSEELPDWAAETIAHDGARAVPCSSNVQSSRKPSVSDSASGGRYFDRVATMISDVADALQHAHDHGVIHRDIKPSNLLLSADGRLSVSDFGLARMLEQPGMTMSGEFVGTPRYMSPEQISAGRTHLDHRTDIYSLGATLYELLTLEPPFPGKTREQVIGQILHKEPRSPRRLNKKIPADLETICLKAIERDPDRRYQTSEQLAGDLRAFANRFAISARRVSLLGLAWKWVHRNRFVSFLLFLLLLTASMAGVMWHRNRLHRLHQIDVASDALLLFAFNDQFEEARKQLKTAQQFGASPAQSALMKAQVDLLQEKSDEVVIELESIGGELANSTAAYAMLTIAYWHTGQEADCFRRLPALIDRPASTYQDRLLRGWAEVVHLPHHAVRDLEEAVHLRQSNMANLLLAEALTWKALYSPDRSKATEDVTRALDIIRAIRELATEKKPWVEGMFVFATVVETDLVVADRRERVNRLREIRHDVEQLRPWASVSEWACLARMSYLQRSERIRDLFEAFQENPPPKSPYAHVHHVIELFRAHRDQDAAQAFDRIAPSLRNRVDHIRAFIAMSSPNADRDQIAAEFLATKSLLTRDLQAMVYRHFDIWTLQLLGKATEAKEFAEESRQTTKQLEDTWPHFKVGNLASGDSAEEILEACSQDREALAHAYFALGVNCLAAGDWDVAKLQFKNVLETDQFPNYVYSWSAAFLQRLEDDPNWLPWLRKAHNTNGDSESSRD